MKFKESEKNLLISEASQKELKVSLIYPLARASVRSEASQKELKVVTTFSITLSNFPLKHPRRN